MNVRLYINTLRYLKASQIWHQAIFRLETVMKKVLGADRSLRKYYKEGRPVLLSPPVPHKRTYLGNDEFCIINVCHKFTEWDDDSMDALWLYNLNYMDFILQDDIDKTEALGWIMRFIGDIPANSRFSEPYPVSLRCMNWIKFVSLNSDSVPEDKKRTIDTLLYSQLKWLSRHTEKRLLANHYLENGFALLFGSVYFGDAKLFAQADYILRSQLDEQILEDGAHCELSPMYHCIMTERVLDCVNLLSGQSYPLGPKAEMLLSFLSSVASRMLGWLTAMVPADRNIPLFGDSALDIAVEPSALYEYAGRLNVKIEKGILGASGYRLIASELYNLWFDVGNVGLSYNAGHAHADTLSFIMDVMDKPFLVDSGVSTYNACDRRFYERSTEAHNTVCVNGRNSSSVWGAFRCAERCSVTVLHDDDDYISASHNGFAGYGVECFRSIRKNADGIVVEDRLCGDADNVTPEAFFYLSPNVRVIETDGDSVRTEVADIRFAGAYGIKVENVCVSERYNMLEQTSRIRVSFTQALTTIITIV